MTSRKLLAVWFVVGVAAAAAIFWLRPGFAAAVKLTTVFALVGGAFTIFLYRLSRTWSSAARRLEEFISALPAQEANVPPENPPELQDLSRAMNVMAGRIRQIVDRANLEFYRRETILAGLAEGVLAVDTGLRVMFCNDAFAHSFNARTPVAQGRSLYEVVREPVLRETLERVVSTGTPETGRFQLPSAAGRWFEARAAPLGDGSPRGAIIILHDVTDIQRQEQLRKDFVADVSHELRTPLAAIRGYAETLLDGALEDQNNNRKFVQIILSHAIRLNNIASDLLVISELDSSAQPPSPTEPVSVSDVIGSAIRSVENSAASGGVRIVCRACGEYRVAGHRFRLEQALVNLLDNAVKFNRPEGQVTVTCGYTEDHRVEISIADTGIGIPSEDLPRIFERFYRVDKARSRVTGGTGLGLSIVKQVVQAMGGSVTVESRLGEGSKFTILLPGV